MPEFANGKGESLLVAQQDAIFTYLDGLLREIPDEYPDEAVAVVDSEIQDWEVAVPAPPLPATAQPLADSVPPPAVAPSPVVTRQAEPVEKVAAPEEPAVPAPPAAATMPEWSTPDFQALLFQVGGLKLAVPLVKLHSVVPWDDQVTPMPNQPSWMYGLLRYRERNVKVVDTATLVLPPDKREPDTPANHILVLGDGQWAISCSSIGQVVKLTPAEVKWRSAAGQRPWLAGTVLDHLCALLDTEAFAQMLAQNRYAARGEAV